jgi:3-deoxy-manno-octulosonate cytidylyltransferase (CMP-KDO synthetase)
VSFKVVIPARYSSARLPAKPLLNLGGRPMVQWVIEAAMQSGADEVLVATDDERIAAVAIDPRTQKSIAVMTSKEHLSGTDRIAEVASQRGWGERTIVVNVQGDEPQLPPALVGQVASLLEKHTDADIATLSTPITTLHEFLDPNAVKVVTAANGVALYFSRAPIPWDRDGATQGFTSQTRFTGAQRHLGIYAYRVAALKRMTALPPGQLELTEKLEQLRALQAGMKLVVDVASVSPPAGIDTQADMDRVRASLSKR